LIGGLNLDGLNRLAIVSCWVLVTLLGDEGSKVRGFGVQEFWMSESLARQRATRIVELVLLLGLQVTSY